MKRIRVTAIVGGVVLAASLLGACSKGSSSSSTTTAANKTTTTAATTGTNFEQFQDPSGKVQCAGGQGAFVGSNVVCESASGGKSFFVSLNSDGTIVKTSGWQPDKALPTLPAGSTSILGAADGKGIYCVGAADGVTCKAQNGKGFTITSTSLTYVGGAVAAN
jgi:hypothetical protein